jgi:hypothetical protein
MAFVDSNGVRLYHRTRSESVPDILAQGFRDSTYNSEPEMERGTWFRTDPDEWTAGNPAILAIDLPEDRMSEKWRSKLDPADRQIPSRHIRDLPIEVI